MQYCHTEFLTSIARRHHYMIAIDLELINHLVQVKVLQK